MESIRAVGYTLETAIADIIDNSIAAASTNVWIDFSSFGKPYIAMIDDGRGMPSDEARHAMRLAATNPNHARSASDLGRFGLGLKTASLSQCRVLTLVSKQGDAWVGYRWDLDHLARSGTWELICLEPDECHQVVAADRLSELEHGTVVAWEDLDQLTAQIGTTQGALDTAMHGVRDHLSLVFHRFISGDGPPRTRIHVNDVTLPALDPFLRAHRATQKGPQETLTVAGERVDVQPYTLPFISKLGKKDREQALGPGSLRDSQGFYIYRAYRLVIWGTWFRLSPRSELGKLARVQVDVPNTLDHLWSLDIKKSLASPPPEVRQQLKRLSEQIVVPSRKAQTFRGRTEKNSDGVVRIWNVVSDRATFRYEVNRDHPAVQECFDAVSGNEEALSRLLALVESTFPTQDVHNRLGRDEVDVWSSQPMNDPDSANLAHFWRLYSGQGRSLDDFIKVFEHVEPFNQIRDFAQHCHQELQP
jgi:hypothetical protein